MAETKAWAVVTKRGRVESIGMTKGQAIYLACKEIAGVGSGYWQAMCEQGYRCIRVTITEDTK